MHASLTNNLKIKPQLRTGGKKEKEKEKKEPVTEFFILEISN